VSGQAWDETRSHGEPKRVSYPDLVCKWVEFYKKRSRVIWTGWADSIPGHL